MALPTQAIARTTDPSTSHAAAETIRATDMNGCRFGICQILVGGRMLTDAEILSVYHDNWNSCDWPRQSDSGIRSRRAELVDEGLVIDSGERGITESGRSTVKWMLAPHVTVMLDHIRVGSRVQPHA